MWCARWQAGNLAEKALAIDDYIGQWEDKVESKAVAAVAAVALPSDDHAAEAESDLAPNATAEQRLIAQRRCVPPNPGGATTPQLIRYQRAEQPCVGFAGRLGSCTPRLIWSRARTELPRKRLPTATPVTTPPHRSSRCCDCLCPTLCCLPTSCAPHRPPVSPGRTH